MRNNVKNPVLPELSVIDFSGPQEVSGLVKERCRHMFGAGSGGYIDDYMQAIEDLFDGRLPGYQAMDTAYHDIGHTMQATLCLVELLNNRHLADATPRIAEKDFKRTLVGVLFHDIGYLKKTGDNEGSGAKYTHVHEKRSCTFVREFLLRRGWSDDDIRFVENVISATGPTANVTLVPFRSEIERTMGQSVCTADYIGQMSDPDYPDKLEVLFGEFRESFEYQGIPESRWPFTDYESLLRGTPGFWSSFVQHKLDVECAGVSRYLEQHPSGENPYMDSIERNMAEIKRRIASLQTSTHGAAVSGL